MPKQPTKLDPTPMDTTHRVRYNYGNPESSTYRRRPPPTAIGRGLQENRKRISHIRVLIHLTDSRRRGQPNQKTNRPQGSATAMGIRLTPLASLCLGVVRGWINVVRRGKGGQIDDAGTAWTRLPAEQLRDQLAREFMVEVTTRTVQRALKELEDTNQIRREQRLKHRYRRDYWYALPEHEEALEAHRPRTIAGKFKSERRNASVPIETTRATGHVLPTPISNTHISKPQPKNQQPERRNTLSVAIDACMSMGKRPQAQGFGGGQAPKEQQVGTDAQGRALKEVWVRGTKHLVVD